MLALLAQTAVHSIQSSPAVPTDFAGLIGFLAGATPTSILIAILYTELKDEKKKTAKLEEQITGLVREAVTAITQSSAGVGSVIPAIHSAHAQTREHVEKHARDLSDQIEDAARQITESWKQ